MITLLSYISPQRLESGIEELKYLTQKYLANTAVVAIDTSVNDCVDLSSMNLSVPDCTIIPKKIQSPQELGDLCDQYKPDLTYLRPDDSNRGFFSDLFTEIPTITDFPFYTPQQTGSSPQRNRGDRYVDMTYYLLGQQLWQTFSPRSNQMMYLHWDNQPTIGNPPLIDAWMLFKSGFENVIPYGIKENTAQSRIRIKLLNSYPASRTDLIINSTPCATPYLHRLHHTDGCLLIHDSIHGLTAYINGHSRARQPRTYARPDDTLIEGVQLFADQLIGYRPTPSNDGRFLAKW